MEKEMVTIPRSEYKELLKRNEWLDYLEAAGVDNWPGYEHAIEMREECENKEKGETE